MSWEFLQKNRLVSFAIFLCVIAILVWLFFPERNSSTNITDPSKEDVSLESRRVFIKDFHIYQDSHDPHTGSHAHGSIENTLYTYVSQEKPGLYTGTIRKDSFKETSEVAAELLVDIEPAQVTYVVKLLNPDKKGYKPISVLCAPENQQVNPGVKCIDGGMPL